MNEDLVSSGITALDAFMGGGFPRGFTILLLAPTGSGAEVFTKQFAAGHPNEKVTYVTTDEPEREIRRAVRESGWNFDTVDILDLQSDFADRVLQAQQRKQNPDEGRRKFDARDLVERTDSLDLMRARRSHNASATKEATSKVNYLNTIIEPFTRLKAPDRMVIDGLDFFLNMYPPEEVVTSLHALKAANAKHQGIVLWVLSKGAHDASTERRLELMADCLIEMEVTRKGTTFERFFMVKKVKNRSSSVGVSTYEIRDTGFELETLERIV